MNSINWYILSYIFVKKIVFIVEIFISYCQVNKFWLEVMLVWEFGVFGFLVMLVLYSLQSSYLVNIFFLIEIIYKFDMVN